MKNDTEKKILKHMQSNIPVTAVKETASTNLLAKQSEQKTALFVAERQTGGRGRLGRSFVSPEGGIYMSLRLDGDGLGFENALLITAAASVAVSKAIEEVCGIKTEIKWVNDIYINGRKLCGILTEAVTEGEELKAVIIGIGINFSTPKGKFPEVLQNTVCSLYESEPEGDVKERLIASIADRLCIIRSDCESGAFLQAYRDLSCVINKKIRCISGEREFNATAVDIDSRGGLVVITEESERITLSSGEITLRTL